MCAEYIVTTNRMLGVWVFLITIPYFVTSTHLTTLMDYLVEGAGNYMAVLPPDVPLHLDVTVRLEEIKEISDVQEKMSTKVRVQVSWYDYYFGWNSTEFYLKSLILQQKAIWKPDIGILNEVSSIKALGSNDLPLTLYGDDKMIYWAPMTIAETKCDFDLEYYPYDVQKCDIKVGTIASSMEHIIFANTECQVAENVEGTGSWTFEKMDYNITTKVLDRFLNLEHQVIICTVHIKRKPNFIILNVIFPIILLGILNSLSFMIPDESGEKVSYSITLFLTFAVFITIMMDRMPENGDKVTKIQLYLMYQLAISVLIIIICVIQMRLQRSRLHGSHHGVHSSENRIHEPSKETYTRQRRKSNSLTLGSNVPDPHEEISGKYTRKSEDSGIDRVSIQSENMETIILEPVKPNGIIVSKDYNDNQNENGKETNRWAMLQDFQRKEKQKRSGCLREMLTVDFIGFCSVFTLQVVCNAWFFASILI